jgi:hypothetical protein
MKMGGFLRGKHLGTPSVFDIATILFIIGLPLFKFRFNRAMMQGIFLVFGIITLMCISVGVKKQRDYKSIPLSLLALWGIVGVFWHSFKEATDFGLVWINWSLLNEGFLYIFLGVFLILTIVRYAKSWGWYYPALLFAFGYGWKNAFGVNADGDWSMTPILAVLLGIIFAMLRKVKRIWLTVPVMATFVGVVLYKWDYIWKTKWVCRPDVWKATIERIIHSKWWMGHGFYHTINTRLGLISPEHKEFEYLIWHYQGQFWRHNDLFEFGEYAGIIGMLAVAFFVGRLLFTVKPGLSCFFVVTTILMCMFQRTIYFPVKGGLIAVAWSLGVLECRG